MIYYFAIKCSISKRCRNEPEEMTQYISFFRPRRSAPTQQIKLARKVDADSTLARSLTHSIYRAMVHLMGRATAIMIYSVNLLPL